MGVRMRRVTGIGGIFMSAKDPKALCDWYKKHLGIDVQDWGGAAFDWTDSEGRPTKGTTAWSIGPADGKHFAPSKSTFMVNYRVEDLAALLKALRVAIAGAAAVATGAARAPRQGAGDMERVQGIGGFFFRAKDPKTLAGWYEANLGVPSMPKNWRSSAGTTAWAPFKEDTSYFGDQRFQWMINFRVRDLDKMVAQLREGGITVELDSKVYSNRR